MPAISTRPKQDDHTSFQCACGPLTLCGDIEPVCVVDPTCPPSDIIPSNTDFRVDVKFEIFGTVVPRMGGDFDITVAFESIGNGPEMSLSPVRVPVTSGTYSVNPTEGPERDYVVKVPVPNSDGKLTEGVYLLSAYVTYTGTNNKPGPVAGMSPEKFLHIMPKSSF